MNKDILTVKDLNKYLPAVKTKVDIHFKDKLSEGLFKTDAIAGLKKMPNESVDLIVTEPSLDPNNTLTYTEYVNWIDQWMDECKNGQKNFLKTREKLAEHPVEKVGAELRALMPWIAKKKLIDSDKK